MAMAAAATPLSAGPGGGTEGGLRAALAGAGRGGTAPAAMGGDGMASATPGGRSSEPLGAGTGKQGISVVGRDL